MSDIQIDEAGADRYKGRVLQAKRVSVEIVPGDGKIEMNAKLYQYFQMYIDNLSQTIIKEFR
jgi:hypothetical protein